ncbi:MAG TPA: NADH-quinone oxidoreductase subunit A [Anaerolineales bacterium]|nr:NADH-quinone oxidoreductase subunit A [Anaerolineales bacterium]
MQSDWIFIGLFLLIVALFPGAPIFLAGLIAPHKSSTLKSQTYECGIETVGSTWVQFRVQYYIFALTFLVFDVELVFLFPWAVAFDQLTLFGLGSGVIFILILFIELLAAWRKGVLEWV